MRGSTLRGGKARCELSAAVAGDTQEKWPPNDSMQLGTEETECRAHGRDGKRSARDVVGRLEVNVLWFVPGHERGALRDGSERGRWQWDLCRRRVHIVELFWRVPGHLRRRRI
jgi:hypothetical protein